MLTVRLPKPVWLITCVFVSSVLATHASVASEAMLRDFFTRVTTLQANFEQKVIDETGFNLDSSHGVFSLSRPRKFRWDYAGDDLGDDDELSQGQQFIADGEFLYVYTPDLDQVSRRNLQDAFDQVPSLVLAQSGESLDDFFVIGNIGLTDGLSWVSLQPKDTDAGYQQLLIGFDAGTLAEIELLDGLGNMTTLKLSQTKTNITLPRNRFEFEIPDGVDLSVE